MRSVQRFEKRDVLEAVRSQRARTIALLEDLRESDWELPALPGWSVRHVAAHLVSTDEAALTGRLLALGLRQVPIRDLEAWNDEQVVRWVDRPAPALLHGLDVWGRRLVRAVSLLPAVASSRPIPSPLGRVSLLWLAMMRVYDEWVHDEDIRRALGLPADDAPEAVGPPARQLLAAIPLQTLPRIPTGHGVVRIEFADVEVPSFGLSLSERRYGHAILGADAVIKANAAALIMAAAGRDRWEEAENSGALSIEGDRRPAVSVLDALLVV